ncbi:sensor histidine kinase [Rhizocola hellebori]|uniref:sensor histidine kinase n=1 Tax=Rhizocola hellebori TaxID=1392758 RepID=UPI0019407EAC|nr:histidine kinase [Rhizocola hellebori]
MQTPLDRAARLKGWPQWPLAAVTLLTLAAAAELPLAWPAWGDAELGVLINVLAVAPLLLARNRLPLAAAAIGSGVAMMLTLYGTLTVTALIGQLAVLYLCFSRYARPAASAALLPLAANAVYPFTGDDSSRPLGLLLLCAGLAAAWLGDARRQRAQLIATHDSTLAQAHHEQAVLAERTRIARELHDVVAHHVSMMVVQAETARVGTADLPQAGRDSFAAIGATGRLALTEMRRLLGVLRMESAPALEPQPGLDRLDELVAAARAAGNEVRVRRIGRPQPLPAGLDVSAYRIIQEALTNVRRHAPQAAAEVVVLYTEEGVEISVDNDGPAAAIPSRTGHGLLGMRERANMAGGVLSAGPKTDGGFRVYAQLPVWATP